MGLVHQEMALLQQQEPVAEVVDRSEVVAGDKHDEGPDQVTLRPPGEKLAFLQAEERFQGKGERHNESECADS